jgi:tRNA U55 pseudouridine synthase TruB
MAYTFEKLKHTTLAELREIAASIDHEAVQGYTQLNKEHLIPAICKALNIDMHEHHQVVGLNKAEIKELKVKRDAALAAQDQAQLKLIRRQIHRVKRPIHKALSRLTKGHRNRSLGIED